MRAVTAQPPPARQLWHDGLTGNARRIAEALRSRGGSTRAELIAATGLSRPTVSATLGELARDGLIAEGARAAGALGGRPAAGGRPTRGAGPSGRGGLGRRHVPAAGARPGHEGARGRAAR